MPDYAEDKHIKEAFENGNYTKLANLIKSANPESAEALIYKGIMAEHGLQRDKIDLKEAKNCYIEAYNKGSSRAGTYLAKIYEKEGKEAKAIEIYQAIKLKEDESAIYARYRLNLIFASKLFQGQIITPEEELAIRRRHGSKNMAQAFAEIELLKNNKATDLVREWDEIIKSSQNANPNLYAKALYNKGMLKLKLAEESINKKRIELDKQAAKAIAAKKFSPAQSAQKYQMTKKLEDEIKQKLEGELSEAKAILNQAKVFGSKKADAELSNMEAKFLLELKNYPEALIKCDQALAKDTRNINSRILKSVILEIQAETDAIARGSNKIDREQYSLSLELAREALIIEPTDAQALKRRKELALKLTRELNLEITEKLKSKADNKSKPYIDELSVKIAYSLSENHYFLERASFNDISKISEDLSARIWRNIQSELKQNKHSPELAIKLADYATEEINNFIKKENAIYSEADPSDKPFLEKRRRFKTAMVQELRKYHTRCAALTEEGSDLEAKLTQTWLDAAGDTAQTGLPPLAGFLGPNRGGLALGVLASLLKITQDQINTYRKQSLYDAANNYAKIGEVKGERDEHYVGNAEKKFEYIAEEMIARYGMQLDNVELGEEAKLAKIATEKMLNHLNNSSTSWVLVELFTDPAATIADFIRRKFSKVEKDGEDTISTLLEGITKGKPTSISATKIKTDNSRVEWFANEIFEKPAITSDGKNFYCDQNSDPEKYGARYQSSIPLSHKKTEAPQITSTIEVEFKRHRKLLNYTTLDQSTSHQEETNKINQQEYAENKRTQRSKLIIAGVTTLLGTASLLGTFLLESSIVLGVTAASGGAIVAAALAIGGVFLLSKGVIDVIKSSDMLERLERKNLIKKEIYLEKSPEELAFQAKLERESNFSQKYKNNPKYSFPTKTDAAHENTWSDMFLKSSSSQGKFKHAAKELLKRNKQRTSEIIKP
jgi:hypothetical protein